MPSNYSGDHLPGEMYKKVGLATDSPAKLLFIVVQKEM